MNQNLLRKICHTSDVLRKYGMTLRNHFQCCWDRFEFITFCNHQLSKESIVRKFCYLCYLSTFLKKVFIVNINFLEWWNLNKNLKIERKQVNLESMTTLHEAVDKKSSTLKNFLKKARRHFAGIWHDPNDVVNDKNNPQAYQSISTFFINQSHFFRCDAVKQAQRLMPATVDIFSHYKCQQVMLFRAL